MEKEQHPPIPTPLLEGQRWRHRLATTNLRLIAIAISVSETPSPPPRSPPQESPPPSPSPKPPTSPPPRSPPQESPPPQHPNYEDQASLSLRHTLLEILSEEQNPNRYSSIDGKDDGDVGAEVAHDATELRPDGGLEAEVGGEAVAPPLTFEERGGDWWVLFFLHCRRRSSLSLLCI
ncbi:sulfate transmembrane transporter [Actinidia rufa]|uniref:Sulfate transmembrane transporter n=1 Tax=Actinidia rufa TaxID=165716 RepID=A0A7J0E5L4_9ERIC|nr:sulfate transmembrane transporter [Actinidia rufa]